GTGLAAVQLGHALGARVIATAGSAAKLEVARANGADVCIDYRTEAWIERVSRETHGEGANVIFDPVGGDVFDGSTGCSAFEGRLLVVGFAGGRIADVAGNRVLLKNVSVVGVHWGLYRQRDSIRVRRWMVELLKLAEARQLTPVIWRSFPLERASRALGSIAARESYGKVALIPGSSCRSSASIPRSSSPPTRATATRRATCAPPTIRRSRRRAARSSAPVWRSRFRAAMRGSCCRARAWR